MRAWPWKRPAFATVILRKSSGEVMEFELTRGERVELKLAALTVLDEATTLGRG